MSDSVIQSCQLKSLKDFKLSESHTQVQNSILYGYSNALRYMVWVPGKSRVDQELCNLSHV